MLKKSFACSTRTLFRAIGFLVVERAVGIVVLVIPHFVGYLWDYTCKPGHSSSFASDIEIGDNKVAIRQTSGRASGLAVISGVSGALSAPRHLVKLDRTSLQHIFYSQIIFFEKECYF